MSIFQRIKQGLKKSTDSLSQGLTELFTHKRLDDEALETLEEALIQADMGVEASLALVEQLRQEKFEKEITEQEIREFLAQRIAQNLKAHEKPLELGTASPAVLLMIGVNGAGKTTSIGKLAQKYKQEGKKVLLAAGDTFRAGAVEQLTVWSERADVPVIKPEKEGQDPASVIFKAIEHAKAENYDVVICDTAGRLQNRQDLMAQLEKILRVIKKADETAPHASVLVLDGTSGQNILSQAETFAKAASVTGLIITKLDSTAKGGAIVALAEKQKLPIHYIGVGESIEDLKPFEANAYAQALLDI